MLGKVKNHFEKYNTTYMIIIIAGITYLIMKNVKSSLDAGANGSEMTTLHSSIFSLYNSGDVVTTVHTGKRGHPGFRVKHLTTDINFDTQGSAARAFDLPENIVSKHLNGKLPNAYGHRFERIKT